MSTSITYIAPASGTTLLAYPSGVISRTHIEVLARNTALGAEQVVFEGDLLVQDVDFTVGGSGQITLLTPADGETDYLIRRATPRAPLATQQPGALSSSKINLVQTQNGNVNEEQDDAISDALAIISERYGRNLRVPSGSLDPISGDRAGKFLGFGPTGQPIAVSGLSTGADPTLREDLLGENGWDIIGTKYPEAGSKIRAFAEVASKTIELSGFTGADPTGSTDSMTAFKAALAATASRRGELVVDGYYRLNNTGVAAPTITQPTKIAGRDPRRGNIPGNNSTSLLYFEGISPDAIIVNDTQLTVDGVSVTGRARDTSGNAFRTIGENSALRLCGGSLVQSFQTAVRYENGYYHLIDDATIADCVGGLAVSASSGGIPQIYNLICDKLKVVGATQTGANSTCATIANGSQVIFANSSFESFTQNGIVIVGNTTTVAVLESYFEGFAGDNILLLAGAAVNAFRNYVYLTTGAATFINAAENTISINAGQNRFAIPELSDTAACIAYKLRLLDSASQTNIGGDQWSTSPGANAVYVESAGGATYRRGKHVVQYPVGHPRQFEPINTLGFYASPGYAGGYDAPVTSLASWLCNGDPTNDDPIGARAANDFAWGGHPYLAVKHKNQWEKVGLRLANIADATDQADVVTKFNLLLARLRGQAVML